MATTLLIHYDPVTPDRATWSHVNNHGELTSRITSGPLTDAAAVAEQGKAVVLLDSTSVHLNHVQLPTSNRQKMMRAIPFVLEEQLAEDIDNFHFVIGKTDPHYGTPVAAIRKDTIDDLINAFEQAGITIEAVIPDAVCSPSAADQWSVLLHADKALVQYQALIGTVIDTDNLPLLLQARLDKTEDRPGRIVILHLDGEEPDVALEHVAEDLDIIKLAYNTHPLVVFCGEFARAKKSSLIKRQR